MRSSFALCVAIVILQGLVAAEFANDVAVNKTARNDPNRVPIVNVFNTGIHDDPIKTHILIFVDRRKDYWQSLQKNFIEVAREYDDRLLHVVVPSDDTEIEALGLRQLFEDDLSDNPPE